MNALINTILILAMIVICPSILTADYHQSELNLNSTNDFSMCLASKDQGSFADADDSSKMVQKPKRKYVYYPSYKSESTAFFLGLIPGFIIHGLGHFYAGDGTTGLILLGTELVTGPISLGYMIGKAFDESQFHGENSYKNVIGVSCIFIFFGSWLYDAIHAPFVVEKYNREAKSKIRFYGNESGNVMLGLSITF